jgi:hypothetical protein
VSSCEGLFDGITTWRVTGLRLVATCCGFFGWEWEVPPGLVFSGRSSRLARRGGQSFTQTAVAACCHPPWAGGGRWTSVVQWAPRQDTCIITLGAGAVLEAGCSQ